MENQKEYIVGIDLHGTLLNPEWEIDEELLPELTEAINRVRDFCKVVLCTGNDLSFVEETVPEEVRDLLDGYVLETGCTMSEDGETEEPIVDVDTEVMMKDLEEKLIQAFEEGVFSEVDHFGKRLATISMFTIYKGKGVHPKFMQYRVENMVKALGYGDKVIVTRSDVAVDIIPIGHNKMTGLLELANGLKTIGIADSLNDGPMIKYADHAYVPSNASTVLINELADSDEHMIVNIDSKSFPNAVKICTQTNTRAVIEALNHIADNLNPNKK
ncbi:HAD hydrolase family protein [Patescibacteria group bacterium]